MTTHFVLQTQTTADHPEPARIALTQIENLVCEFRTRTGTQPRVVYVAADVFVAFGDLPYVIAGVSIEVRAELPLGTILVKGEGV